MTEKRLGSAERKALRIGSLCSGYGGLELGLITAIGGTVAWHAEVDPDACKVLEHHWPDVPNHGDVWTAPWADVEPVDWLTAGYPCQPFSHAGLRKGTDDERHLWPAVADAIRLLRPRNVLLENVAGHIVRGFGQVLGDLAEIGYDTRWLCLRAANAGAPHRRERVFVVARDTESEYGSGAWPLGAERDAGSDREPGRPAPQDTDRAARGERRQPAPRQAACRGTRADTGRRGRVPVPDTTGNGRDERRTEPARLIGRPDASLSGSAPADTDSRRREGRQERHSGPTGPQLDRTSRHDPGRLDTAAWGDYAPAIHRWERVTGRTAPSPTEPGRTGDRLSPRFVEWLMGLDDGHVTAVPGLTRNAQLRILGNGVVPQQAALAVTVLLHNQREAAA